MFVAESRACRHLIVRLPRGADLLSALQELLRARQVQAAWIQGLGAFEWVELCEYDQRALRYLPARRIDRAVELLHLEGNVSLKDGEPFVHLHATVSYERPDGIEVLGGHLVAARVFACELRLAVFEDVALHREDDPATGLSLWPLRAGAAAGASGPAEPEAESDPWAAVARVSESAEAAAEPSASAEQEGAVGWGDVAAASSARERPEPPAWKAPATGAPAKPARPPSKRAAARREALTRARTPAPVPEPISRPKKASFDFDEPYPEPGDWLDHFRFGLCRVEDDDPEGGVQVLLPSGVRRTIRLDLLEVGAPEERDGRRVFRVRRKR